jgi:hypothetical protein
MIQKNHKVQSKERIFKDTNLTSAFDGTSQQAAYEVALQAEEYDEWHEHADKRGRGEQMPILAAGAHDGRQRHRDHAHVSIWS